MFNKYFQDELTYLRELGREYARAYPALAPLLADRGGDPDVERLLEGVAFLTGRIRQKIDDDFPEFIVSLATLLFPQLVRPFPGAGILELSPLPTALKENRVVPAGSEFDSEPVEGTRCRFSSAMDCVVSPVALGDVRLEPLPGSAQQLRLELTSLGGLPLERAVPERLRLHLAGESRTALLLLMWLCQHLADVVIEADLGGGEVMQHKLGRAALRHVGFEEDEGLLPVERCVFQGFRLLQEYFVLPAKFAFVEVSGLDWLRKLAKKPLRVSVLLRLDRPIPTQNLALREIFRLHCVPIVNVFKTSAEPLRFQHERERYLVRPAGLSARHGEVYRIDRVRAVLRGTADRRDIQPFLGLGHARREAEDTLFYTTHLVPSTLHDGADLYLSIGAELPDLPGLEDDAVLSIDLRATNGELASSVRAGEVRIATSTSPAFVTFSNLASITPHVPIVLGKDLQWRMVAHAAMSFRSLTETDVLRSVISVYDVMASVDRQAARAGELRVAALREVRTRPADKLMRGAVVRGVDVEIDLDESGFPSEGDMFLFGAILERVFASYVSVNSFARTRVKSVPSRVEYQWPARSGNETLL